MSGIPGDPETVVRVHRFVLVFALTYFAAHLAAVLVLRSPAFISNVLIGLLPVVAALACLHQGWRCLGFVRTKWRLLSLGLLFWALGQAVYTYTDSILGIQQTSALTSDFYFFLWGVPALLAIAAAEDDGDTAVFLVLDSIQALLAVLLTYLQLFTARSLFAPEAVNARSLMYLYLGESLVLAAAASLRLLARPSRQERRFYRVLCLFFWVYALVSIPANYADAILRIPTGHVFDVLWDIPFLLLILCLSTRTPAGSRATAPARTEPQQTITALIVYNACPAFFTIAVLILAAHVGRQRLYVGIAAMTVTLFTYTLRAALLQTRYMQSQRALLASEKALREANERLQEISHSDPLTGIANRRRFEQVLEAEWNRALRAGVSLSLLMIDVDHFKDINDHYGHQHGDRCLVGVAQTLARNLRRGGELLARYGGEEFVAILPNVDEEGAMAVAESMRLGVSSSLELAECSAPGKDLTVSIGICSAQPMLDATPAEMVAAADAAMYRAKRRGRNRSELSGSQDLAGDRRALFAFVPGVLASPRE